MRAAGRGCGHAGALAATGHAGARCLSVDVGHVGHVGHLFLGGHRLWVMWVM